MRHFKILPSQKSKKNQQFVGAKKRKALRPSASSEQIQRLAKKVPELAVQAPNINPELFFDLAEMYPIEAMSNPVFQMFTMEFPGRWEEIVQRRVFAFINFALNKTGKNGYPLIPDTFLFKFCKHVLPIYNEVAIKSQIIHTYEIDNIEKSIYGLVEDGNPDIDLIDENYSLAYSSIKSQSNHEYVEKFRNRMYSIISENELDRYGIDSKRSLIKSSIRHIFCLALVELTEMSDHSRSDIASDLSQLVSLYTRYKSKNMDWSGKHDEAMWQWQQIVDYLTQNHIIGSLPPGKKQVDSDVNKISRKISLNIASAALQRIREADDDDYLYEVDLVRNGGGDALLPENNAEFRQFVREKIQEETGFLLTENEIKKISKKILSLAKEEMDRVLTQEALDEFVGAKIPGTSYLSKKAIQRIHPEQPDAIRASDPNLSGEELLRLAAYYPHIVIENPALSLISLENPGLYLRILETIKRRMPLQKREEVRKLSRRHTNPEDWENMQVNEWRDAFNERYFNRVIDASFHGDPPVTPYSSYEPSEITELVRQSGDASFLSDEYRQRWGSTLSEEKAQIILDRAARAALPVAKQDFEEYYGDKVKGRSRVGAKKKIIDTLDVSQDTLAKSKPKEAVKHPNIDLALFRELAKEYPMEAMQNPALGLWILEDPSFWNDIELKNSMHWIEIILKKLPYEQQVQFAIDCVNRILPIHRQWYPDDGRPEDAVESAQQLLLGQASISDVKQAIRFSEQAYSFARMSGDVVKAATYVAKAAAMSKKETAHNAFLSVAYAATAASTEAGIRARSEGLDFNIALHAAIWAERQWQWRHLLTNYLKKEATSVGARTYKSMSKNAALTGIELQRLIEKRPDLAAMNPNISTAQALELMPKYPFFVMANPAFGLWMTEDQFRVDFGDITWNYFQNWLESASRTLPHEKLYVFFKEWLDEIMAIFLSLQNVKHSSIKAFNKFEVRDDPYYLLKHVMDAYLSTLKGPEIELDDLDLKQLRFVKDEIYSNGNAIFQMYVMLLNSMRDYSYRDSYKLLDISLGMIAANVACTQQGWSGAETNLYHICMHTSQIPSDELRVALSMPKLEFEMRRIFSLRRLMDNQPFGLKDYWGRVI